MTRLPVVYVRGFAGGASGINRQVDDPFYGFNDGSTHVRVGGSGDPTFYQFESPLLRLMIDERYELLVRGDQRAYLLSRGDKPIPPNSIWIHRFYDAAATTFGAPSQKGLLGRLLDGAQDRIAAPAGFDIETAARDLYDFIILIREKTGAEKVHLIAHSMGGLVARCMIQKISQTADRIPARDLVAKFFTYATPHGGIDFDIGALDWAMEAFGPAGADIFAPDLMYGYLSKDGKWGQQRPPKWDPQDVDEEIFDPKDIFCLIGTNPGDYGLTREVVGPKSDGLVKIDKAYVRKANRAFVHRSHSGRYGEVNSEEGYQNLRRFLFGRHMVKVDLRGVTLPRTRANEIWQADVRVTVRGLPVVLHEQVAAHYCPVQLNKELDQHQDNADAPVPLTTTFLLDPSDFDATSDPPPPRSRYTLSLRVFHLQEKDGGFFWQSHLEQVADWEDTLIVDVGRSDDDKDGELRTWIAWNSSVAGAIDTFDPITKGLLRAEQEVKTFTGQGDDVCYEICLPEICHSILGDKACIRLTVSSR
ncbi:MAG: esterase/lipase family protein [Pseudonocardiaceae bacterium]